MAAFPTVSALADASEDQVLHLWTGLGYYARARNLLRCAPQVCAYHAGQFPADIEGLSAQPGICSTTAAANRSIAFAQPAAILDGNVKRVLARYGAIGGWPGKTAVHNQLWELAESLSPQQRSADYCQAMMDLGATVCTRSSPACEQCPLAGDCIALASATQADYPGKKPRKVLPVKSTTMLLITNPGGEVFLARRPPSGIWGGLWSFPEVESETDANNFCLDTFGHAASVTEHWTPLRHTFSHYHLDIQPLHLKLPHERPSVMEGSAQLWYNRAQPDSVGMAAPVAKLLKLLDK
jgi:A/G-specific adenine glycosylase